MYSSVGPPQDSRSARLSVSVGWEAVDASHAQFGVRRAGEQKPLDVGSAGAARMALVGDGAYCWRPGSEVLVERE